MILAIETSCDDTGIAIIDYNRNIIFEKVLSQAKKHSFYGGVVPELASRYHLISIQEIFNELTAKINIFNLKYIAVTTRPGLIGSLIVGISFAKSIALALNIPLIEIDHLEAHMISANLTKELEYPLIFGLFSGGNSQISIAYEFENYKLISKTLDDAAGEALDKSAKIFGLNYPGGPEIEKRALLSKNKSRFEFSVPMMNKRDIDFSYSGLKTQVLNKYTELKESKLINDDTINDLCYSVQDAIGKSISFKIQQALDMIKKNENINIKQLIFCGGVAANKTIAEKLIKLCDKNNLDLVVTPLKYSGDNGVMIGICALEKIKKNQITLA